MSMTRRDIVDMAAIFKNQIEEIKSETYMPEDEQEVCAETVKILAVDFADMLSDRNPAFDRERFLKDSGIN